jgi:hypothetical protein
MPKESKTKAKVTLDKPLTGNVDCPYAKNNGWSEFEEWSGQCFFKDGVLIVPLKLKKKDYVM